MALDVGSFETRLFALVTFGLSFSGVLAPACDATAPSSTPEHVDAAANVDVVVDAGTSLRAAAGGLLVGAAVDARLLEGLGEGDYPRLLAAEFNAITPENAMKWGPLQPTRSRYEYGPADTIVAFARAHAMTVKGHTLVWHQQLPTWIHEQMTREELRAALLEHVTNAVTHFKGQVASWDVVNEAFSANGELEKLSIFTRKFGDDSYVADAFRAAHAADPEALLFYNDWGIEVAGAKANAVFSMVQKMLAAGVPIHGVGFQGHLGTTPRPIARFKAQLERFAGLGLKVNVSELDVPLPESQGDLPALFEAQRTTYHDVVATCAAISGCVGVTIWGFTDKHTWLTETLGYDAKPLPFDADYRPKRAYSGVLDALMKR